MQVRTEGALNSGDMMAGNVTIKDVANELGIARATVDRALHNRPCIDPKLKKKVLRKVKELNYIPNILGRNLVLQRTNTIGLIVKDITNTFVSKMVRRIEDIAAGDGYSVILCDTGGNQEKEKTSVRLLKERRVDGLIINPIQIDNTHLIELKNGGYCFVLLERFKGNHNVDYVTFDDVKAGYLATQHFAKLGHKRIAYLGGPSENFPGQERFKGYKKALRDYNLKFNKNCVVTGGYGTDEGCKAMQKFLRLSNKPTAIFVFNDLESIGALKAIEEKGLKVPDDIALIGVDNLEVADYLKVPLTTIALPNLERGEESLRILFEKIESTRENKVSKTYKVVLEPHLVVRESSGRGVKIG